MVASVGCRRDDEAKECERMRSSLTENDYFFIKWHYHWDTGEKIDNPPKDVKNLRELVHDKGKHDKMLEAFKNRRAILEEKRLREIEGNPLQW